MTPRAPQRLPQSDRAKAAGVKPSKVPRRVASTTTAKIERILARIESGELVRASCAAEQLNPRALYEWEAASPDHAKRYARARQRQADAIVEETFDIADDSSNDELVDDEGRIRQNSEWIARSRLRVDTRKWYASKIAPRLYGDKVDVTSDGEKLQSFTLAIGTA